MNHYFSKLVAGALLIAGAAYAELPALSDYLNDAAVVVPNKLRLSAYQEFGYKDNILEDVDRDEAFYLKTGVQLSLFRETGLLRYGVDGDVSYKYYTRKPDDTNCFEWDIAPILELGTDGDIDLIKTKYQKLRLDLIFKNKYERLSADDNRFARHYTSGAALIYELKPHERWGVIAEGNYLWEYYPQSDFKDQTNQKLNAILRPYYDLTSKIKLGLEGNAGKTWYREDTSHEDSTNYKGYVFMDYRISQKFSSTTKVGVSRKEYSGESEDTNNDRKWVPSYSVALRYTPSDVLAFVLNGSVDLEDSYSGNDSGSAVSYKYTFSTVWKASRRLAFTQVLGLQLEDEKNSQNDTREFICSFRGDYALSKNISLYAQYKFDDVHFEYVKDSNYYYNEVFVGVRYSF